MIPTSDSKLSLDPSMIDKVVESVSFPPDLALSSESVKIEVVSLTKSSSYSSLPVENEPKPTEVFMLRSDYSQ